MDAIKNRKKEDTQKKVKLIMSIVSRGNGDKISTYINDLCVGINFETMGKGTARTSLLSYFGLGSVSKDVLLSLVPEDLEQEILKTISNKLELYLPGNGIAFSIPLANISSVISNTILSTGNKKEDSTKGASKMNNKFVLIVCSVKNKVTDNVIDAARDAGATGGTVVSGRGVGNDKAEHFLGVSLHDTVDIVLILTLRETKNEIMTAIKNVAGITSEGNGVLFSLPVDELVGLGRFSDTADDTALTE